MSQLLEQNLIELTKTKNWQAILKIGENYELDEKSKFLWAWPTVQCLEFLKIIFEQNNISEVLSIGCGSGLLEWIISHATGVHVSGVELDNSWWRSPYSPTTFIKLNFINGGPTRKFLLNSTTTARDLSQVAVLFCYFNNRQTFLDYIEAFDGNIVIIIGPSEENGFVTDPRPLRPEFVESGDFRWVLIGKMPMETIDNCLAIYQRCFH